MRKVIPFSSSADDSKPAAQATAAASQRSAPAQDQQAWLDGAGKQLFLLQRLVGCANEAQALERYARWLGETGLAGGLQYDSGSGDNALAFGNEHHHSAHYTLQLEKAELGAVTLFRRTRFSEDELAEIEQSLGYLARCLQTAQELRSLQTMVTQDPLTGLGNRSHLQHWITRELSRARRYHGPLSVMMVDVDHFKRINDALGHLGGDHVLQTIADVFKRSTRGSDLLFRYGGDEFTIVLPHTDLRGAEEAAQQIRQNLAKLTNEELGIDEMRVSVRPDVSIGIASYHAGDDEESLLQRADTHLYHAKANGRGRVCTCV